MEVGRVVVSFERLVSGRSCYFVKIIESYEVKLVTSDLSSTVPLRVTFAVLVHLLLVGVVVLLVVPFQAAPFAFVESLMP